MNETALLGTAIKNTFAVSCFVHPGRPATRVFNIPCAPNGRLYGCDECATEAGIKAVFEKYKASHEKNIKVFTQRNPNS